MNNHHNNNLHIIYAQVFSAAFTENLKIHHVNENAIYLAKRAAAAACDAFLLLYGEKKEETKAALARARGDRI